MGTCFTAILNHNLDERRISDLPELFNRTWHTVEPLLPLMEGYPVPGTPPRKWRWSEERGFSTSTLLSNDTARIEGYEFDGIVSKHMLRVCHALKWSWFLEDEAVRSKVDQVCRHVASVFGANQIVYLPSGFLKPEGAIGLMYEGKFVEDMIEWLLKNCGPPAQSLDSFDLEKLETLYFVERV